MSNNNGYEVLGKTVTTVLLLALASLVNGLVLTRLWAWFVAATFGVQELGVAEAIGLALVARFLIPFEPAPQKDKTFGVLMAEGVARLVLVNGFVLLVGLLVVQFT